jgi:translation elongation factor EF-4
LGIFKRSIDILLLQFYIIFVYEIHCFYRYAGQVGYMVAGMKATTDAWVGDTLYLEKSPVEPLPGFKPAKPMVRSRK